MRDAPVILSLLHQESVPASATRLFRGKPILEWTLRRLAQCPGVSRTTLLCWSDQIAALRRFGYLFALDRTEIASMNAIAAARRWSDGWRGGLLSASCFDAGFHGPSLLAAMRQLETDRIVLVDPDSALIDPKIVDSLLAHASEHLDVEYCFTPAAPGQAAMLLRRGLVEKLAEAGMYPGRLLNYHPDIPGRDPVALPQCAPAPTVIARATERFVLDSQRQITLFENATHELNGQLAKTSAEELLKLARARTTSFDYPRDVTLEINSRRATRPIYSPLRYGVIERPDMTVEMAARIFAQLAQADDVRLTLAGVGDPLLHPRVFEMIQTASSGGIKAIHVETDLLGVGDEQMKQLAASPVDVLSVQIPAVTQTMYRRMMDCDELARLIDNMRVFLGYRSERATPILVPTFVKCRENLGEMEAWYDHWIRNLGCAVIAGPSDCSGQIPDVAAVDMSPPLRVPCRRLASRMMILSSGQVVACENDVHGRYALGQIGVETVSEIWRKGFSSLRAEHAAGRYSLPICQSCRDWHRP
ncbi:MAG TPA: SPASM domain-containing protein [Tepidisphaeraceae bacterium]|jgi:molybdopterin-guanine dinucleotide biosynthesis protein A|nr:SPASM domain-containing protein [Tepidisphaeraceae bacterium]